MKRTKTTKVNGKVGKRQLFIKICAALLVITMTVPTVLGALLAVM